MGATRDGTGFGRAAGLRVVATALVLLIAPACMRNRLAKDYRRPWTRATTVAEDAAWTLESAALGVVAVGSLGLIKPFDDDGHAEGGWCLGWDDEEEDDEDPLFADDGGDRTRGSRGGGRHIHSGARHRAVGTRRGGSGGGSGGQRRVRGTRRER